MTISSNEYASRGGGFCPACECTVITLLEPVLIGYDRTTFLHEDPRFMCNKCGTMWTEKRRVDGYTDLEET